MRNFHFATQCQQLGGKSAFSALEMYQPALISLGLPTAFQADDEGSIPFTRSNDFNSLDIARSSSLESVGCKVWNLDHFVFPSRIFRRPRMRALSALFTASISTGR